MSTLEWRRGGGTSSGGVFRGGPPRRATPSRGGGPRGRGGRNPNGKNPPENAPKPALEQTSKPPQSTSEIPEPVEPPTPASEETGAPISKQKTQPRKGSRVAVPTINVQALPKSDSTPSASPSTTTSSRPPNRRKRSQNNNKSTKPDKATPSRQSKETQATPSLGSTITKDLPPHLAPPPPAQHVDIKGDIDALVERVRAGAMDRPSTPGSHIDWADDDDSLPDLDDWMKPPSTSYNGVDKVESVISPLVMDGLKSLPDEKFQPKSSSLSTISLFPPSAEKSDATDDEKLDPSPVQPQSVLSPAVSPTPPPADKAAENQEDSEADKPGLNASMHAPKNGQLSSVSSSTSLPSSSPANGHLNTSRRPSPAHHRLSRSGASTPADRVRGRHSRNHSTPPVTHRVPATRPVITGDAISRLARTIGGMKTKD